jgi:long-chain acyl-CoA synthetase
MLTGTGEAFVMEPVGGSDTGRGATFRINVTELSTDEHWLERRWLPSLPSSEDAIVAFTTGSTGRPKGVVSTHLGVITGLMNMLLASRLAETPVGLPPGHPPRTGSRGRAQSLLLSPVFHVSGYSQILLTLLLGGRIRFLAHRDTRAIREVMDSGAVDSISGVTVAELDDILGSGAPPSALRFVGVNGRAVHREWFLEMRRAWPSVRIRSGYGLTETNGSIAAASPEDLLEGSSGRVVPSIDAIVTDPDGSRLAAGVPGELVLRGASLMRCYADGQPAMPDGWFRTGDRASLSAEGRLSLLGRMRDTVVIGGRDISLDAIERLVNQEMPLNEAVALALAEADCRSGVCVAVASSGGGRPPDVDALRRLLCESLGIGPERLTVVPYERLPRLASGKVNRAEVRRRIRVANGHPATAVGECD